MEVTIYTYIGVWTVAWILMKLVLWLDKPRKKGEVE